MIISNTEFALAIAMEHITWAQEQGQTPEDVLRQLKQRRAPGGHQKTWAEVIDALVAAWMALP